MNEIVIHGHFYQPPRENPWTGSIDRDPKVFPFHDWNERIHHECYRSNAFARIFDGYARIERIVNNFDGISFNFGPTLLSWLEQYDPPAYRRIQEADRTSILARGHGNAIAQAYNHTILPLATARQVENQVNRTVRKATIDPALALTKGIQSNESIPSPVLMTSDLRAQMRRLRRRRASRIAHSAVRSFE